MKGVAMKTMALAFSAMLAPAVQALEGCKGFDGSDPDLLRHNGEAVVYLEFEPDTIRVGESFDLRLTTCTPGITVRSADATMPSHGHGMNYRPDIETGSNGLKLARGFLFHMPGEWEIRIVVESGGDDLQLVRQLELSP